MFWALLIQNASSSETYTTEEECTCLAKWFGKNGCLRGRSIVSGLLELIKKRQRSFIFTAPSNPGLALFLKLLLSLAPARIRFRDFSGLYGRGDLRASP